MNNKFVPILPMKIIFFCALLVPFLALSQNTISVNIYNVPSSEGNINVAVYDSDKSFLKFEGVIKSKSAPAEEGMVNVKIEDMPEGEYALAIFYDENGNDKLDTNWLGIPKEKVAFSKAKMKTFGPPNYKECAFIVTSDFEISIDL